MKPCADSPRVPVRFHPANFLRRALPAVLSLIFISLRAAESSNPYDTWIKPWGDRPASSASLGGVALTAVVSIVSGEKDLSAVTNMTPVQRLDLAYHLRVAASEMATNGLCRGYFVSNTDAKTGGVRQLSPEEIQKLTETLAQLPDDHSQLPPAGKRVVVQVWENDHWRVRVYDGNNLPPEVKALLDLLANPFDKEL